MKFENIRLKMKKNHRNKEYSNDIKENRKILLRQMLFKDSIPRFASRFAYNG